MPEKQPIRHEMPGISSRAREETILSESQPWMGIAESPGDREQGMLARRE